MIERPSHIPHYFLELYMYVVKEFSNWRADRFVSHKIPRLSRTKVQKILKSMAFDQNGNPVKPNRILKTGDTIILYREPPVEPEVNTDFSVVYEDEWYIAVNKPPRLPVHPTAKYLKNTLTHLLALKYGEDMSPTLVHRLDSETSGIVLCAKTKKAERAGKILFEKREVKKEYKAIVRGIVNPPDGSINLPLSPDPTSIIKARMWCKTEDGLPSFTGYETISRGKNYTFLRLMPKTGRQHQLRVHLDHMGHTIVGDKLYGPDRDIFIDYMQDGLTDDIIRRAGHTRHALHAYKLQLIHPFTEKKLTIEAPMPQDMWDLINKHL